MKKIILLLSAFAIISSSSLSIISCDLVRDKFDREQKKWKLSTYIDCDKDYNVDISDLTPKYDHEWTKSYENDQNTWNIISSRIYNKILYENKNNLLVLKKIDWFIFDNYRKNSKIKPGKFSDTKIVYFFKIIPMPKKTNVREEYYNATTKPVKFIFKITKILNYHCWESAINNRYLKYGPALN